MKKNNLNTLLIIIIVVISILTFIISIGTFDSFKGKKKSDDKMSDKEIAKLQLKRIQALEAKQIKLKRKLNRKFKQIYFGVRLCLLLLWGGMIYSLYLFGMINNFNDFTNYSEISLLIIFIFNFLTFGSLKSLRDYIDSIKGRIKKMVYGKYIDLEERITTNQNRIKEVQGSMKKFRLRAGK